MSIEGNMQAQGKRISSRHEYEIGIDNEGVIQYNDSKYWANGGCNFNDPHAWVLWHHFGRHVLKNIYINKKNVFSNNTPILIVFCIQNFRI